MRSTRSGVRPSPCSIDCTPARRAASIPSHPRACAATGRPSRRASWTIAESSSSVQLGQLWSFPSPPTYASRSTYTLIQSAPYVTCSRTARRSVGGDLGVRPDSRYAVAGDEDALIGPGGVGRHVDEASGAHEHATLSRRLRGERLWEHQENEKSSGHSGWMAEGTEARNRYRLE